MECGSGLDLSDVISHQDIAGTNIDMVRHISTSIGECLDYFTVNPSCGVMHGDVKARNFLYLKKCRGKVCCDLSGSLK